MPLSVNTIREIKGTRDSSMSESKQVAIVFSDEKKNQGLFDLALRKAEPERYHFVPEAMIEGSPCPEDEYRDPPKDEGLPRKLIQVITFFPPLGRIDPAHQPREWN
jgi:hypothetical protein